MKVTWSMQWEVGDLKGGDRLRQTGTEHKPRDLMVITTVTNDGGKIGVVDIKTGTVHLNQPRADEQTVVAFLNRYQYLPEPAIDNGTVQGDIETLRLFVDLAAEVVPTREAVLRAGAAFQRLFGWEEA